MLPQLPCHRETYTAEVFPLVERFVRITHDSDGDAYIPVDNEVLLEELFTEFSELIDEMDEDEE